MLPFPLALLLACHPAQVVLGDAPKSPDDPGPAATATFTDDTVESLSGTLSTEEPDTTEDVPDTLYDETIIHAFSLSVGADAARSLERSPSTWVEATLLYEGDAWTVGIRVKGSSTQQSFDDKPSLIVDLNRYVPGQELMGHKRFNLHNQLYDPSMMSETMSYAWFRSAGLPASRTGYARLSVNEDDYGLYTIVEPPNDDFLERWFENPDGNMYENGYQDCDVDDASCFEREELDEGNDDALWQLSADAAIDDPAEWEAAMRRDLDWPLFIRSLAMDALIAHWDGYAYDRSNYHLYHDPVEDLWTFIPQSMDLDYGWRPWSYDTCGRYGVDPSGYTEGTLARRCLGSETCRAEYVAEILLQNEAFEAADPVGRVDEIYARIADDVRSDNRKYYGDSAFEDHVTCVKAWLAQRPDEIRAWAAAQ